MFNRMNLFGIIYNVVVFLFLAEWHFGPFLCKAVPYFQAVAVSASVNTLVAVAIERYFHLIITCQ